MGRERPRGGGPGAVEAHGAGGERVEVRRGLPLVAVAREVVHPGRVHRNHDERRRLAPDCKLVQARERAALVRIVSPWNRLRQATAAHAGPVPDPSLQVGGVVWTEAIERLAETTEPSELFIGGLKT